MKKLFYIVLLYSLLSVICKAQPVQQEWVQRYNGLGNSTDGSKSIAVDDLGNVYVTGYSYGSGTNYDYATIKYNSSGVQQWVQRYNGPANDYDIVYSLALDRWSNVYVTGYSTGIGTGYDCATVKYNSDGVQQWVQRYNGPANNDDAAYSMKVDTSGNVYITGYSIGIESGIDYITIKYNSSGVQQWVQRYNGPGNAVDGATSIAVDIAGNVYVTGSSIGSGTGCDYATIKYYSSGVQQWVQRYNGTGNSPDQATSIAVDESGNVYVTGRSIGSGTSDDYCTIKYNTSGVQQWVQRYNGPGNGDDVALSIAIDHISNVYVTGFSMGNGTSWDYATIKYDSVGYQQWVQRYNSPTNGQEEANFITVDSSSNVYVTGQSISAICTIKYNTSGVQQWIQLYNSPGNGNDQASSIAVDATGNVYVTGGSEYSTTGWDYTTIKYSQPLGITPISKEIPKSFTLYQNYPNPFNPTTIIKIDVAEIRGQKSEVSLVIYDLLGREVATLVNEKLSPGTYEVVWDANNFSSGIYFYKLIISDPETSSGFAYSETKKLILLK